MKSKKRLGFYLALLILIGGVSFANVKNSYALPEVDPYSFTLRLTNNGLGWFNTQLNDILTSPTVTTMIQNLITKAFTDSTTGNPKALVDTCVSIPLVGMTCLAVYIQDWDYDGYVFTYTVGPTGISANPTPSGLPNAPAGTMGVNINLDNVKLDVHLYTGTAYTSTTGASITDYVLAHGWATVPYLSIGANLTILGGNLPTYWPTATTQPNPQPGTMIGIQLLQANLGVGFHFALTPDMTCPNPLVNDGSQTYKSCLISSLIPYIDAQFNAQAQDNFNSALEYYFGPTMLYDAGTLISSLTFADPFVTGGKITLDAGFYWGFKADNNGIEFYPGGLGLGLKYNLGSCVTMPTGAGPIIMNPIPAPGFEMGGTTPTGGSYMAGIAIHENVLSELLYNVYTDGILCLDINKNTPTLGSLVGTYLTTTIFGLLMPALTEYYPKMPMQISLRPTLISPESGAYNQLIDTPYIKTGPAMYTTMTTTLGPVPAPSTGPSGVWGTLNAVIPHFVTDFYVDTTGTGDYQRVFGLDISLTAGFGITVWTDPNLPAAARVVRVLLADQPSIEEYIPYSAALPLTVTSMHNAISQILPTLLTTAINGRLDLAVNLAPLLGITFDAPYIGPAGLTDPTTGNPSYFAFYASIVGNIDPGMIFTLLSSTGLTSSLGLSSPQPSPMQLGLPYPAAELSVGGLSGSNIVLDAKQTKEAGLTAYSSVVGVSGYEVNGQNTGINYVYSMDNGPWSFYIPGNHIELSNLLEGQHTLRVEAVDANSMESASPATLTFDIDSIPPTLSVTGPQGTVNGSRATFEVQASDDQTPSNEIAISYNLDNKGFSTPSTNKDIVLSGLSSGSHSVVIQAVDLAGNASDVSASFNVVNGAKSGFFGCSTTSDQGNAGLLTLLFMIIVPLVFVYVLKRRERETR